MDLTDFLRAKGASIEGILVQTQEIVRLSPGDILVLCGSVVEGLGDERSDLDLILITSRQDIPFTSLHDVALVSGSCLVDISVVERSEVEALLQRFYRWAHQPRQPRSAKAFKIDDQKLLHRIAKGVPLYGEQNFALLRTSLQSIDLLRHRL